MKAIGVLYGYGTEAELTERAHRISALRRERSPVAFPEGDTRDLGRLLEFRPPFEGPVKYGCGVNLS